jgi:hypothetical protein
MESTFTHTRRIGSTFEAIRWNLRDPRSVARLERRPKRWCDADDRGDGDDSGDRHEESDLVGGSCAHASALSFSVSLTP